MILVLILAILFIGGIVAWLADRAGILQARWVSLVVILMSTALLLLFFMEAPQPISMAGQSWQVLFQASWIPRFGISFALGMDGLSLVLVLLTLFLGVVAILSSWNEIQDNAGFFHFNLLWVLAGVVGVFTAIDLFLFFVFWEVMLIPMYFIIAIWGHENRQYAAIKFFIFTQASGLLLLLAMVVLVYFYQQATGSLSFNYFDLLGTEIPEGPGFLVMLGFFIAFFVKLPGVPLHTWLPDAHTQAPTAGSVILAGVLLKTGAYGLMRFCIPLFPEESAAFAHTAMLLGAIGVVYTAAMAFAQTDVKRLIAYTSVSHMGFIVLGVYAGNDAAYRGAIMTMLAHGMTSAALFAFAGAIQQRIHTRDMREMGGFWKSAPRMGAIVMFFSVAALGMPGLANFVGEFLVLLGAFQADVWLTVVAAMGLILAPVYSLVVIQKVFHGSPLVGRNIQDFSGREVLMMGMMMVVTIWLGVYPQGALDLASTNIDAFLLSATDSGDTVVATLKQSITATGSIR